MVRSWDNLLVASDNLGQSSSIAGASWCFIYYLYNSDAPPAHCNDAKSNATICAECLVVGTSVEWTERIELIRTRRGGLLVALCLHGRLLFARRSHYRSRTIPCRGPTGWDADGRSGWDTFATGATCTDGRGVVCRRERVVPRPLRIALSHPLRSAHPHPFSVHSEQLRAAGARRTCCATHAYIPRTHRATRRIGGACVAHAELGVPLHTRAAHKGITPPTSCARVHIVHCGAPPSTPRISTHYAFRLAGLRILLRTPFHSDPYVSSFTPLFFYLFSLTFHSYYIQQCVKIIGTLHRNYDSEVFKHVIIRVV